MPTLERPPFSRRSSHSRGDTYGVVCAAVLFVLLAAGGLAFYHFAHARAATATAPAQRRGYVLTTSENSRTAPVASVAKTGHDLDDLALQEGMQKSSALGNKKLVTRGVIAPTGVNFQAKFQYEKSEAAERLRVNDGTFVRQGSSPWIHAENWSADAPPVSEIEKSFLDDLVKMVRTPWEIAGSSEPARSYPSTAAILYAKGTTEKERLFSFRRLKEGMRLERFSGPVGNGVDEVQITLDFEYPDSPMPPAGAGPSANGAPGQTVRRALPVKETPAARKTTTRKRAKR